MTFSFHPEAEAEFYEAIDNYESGEHGLGYDFSTEVFATIQNILTYPNACPHVAREGWDRLVTQFHHGVSHRIEHGDIFILAIMHLRRNPDYWQTRHGNI